MASTVTSNPAVTTTPDTQFVGPDVTVGAATGSVSFYGATPVAKQSSSGVTTVAGLITLLQNLGLVS